MTTGTKCEKHQCYYELKEVDSGKTIEICAKCEEERRKQFNMLFSEKRFGESK